MNELFFNLDGVLVDRRILETRFTCELSECKGACCTMESEYGAPILKEEIEIIEEILPEVKNYLSQTNLNAIEKSGFWEEKDESLMIKSVKNRECVFSYFEGDVAKCVIEKAYHDGKINFRKPVSCHLFPIRIGDFGGKVLKYEHYSQCEPALQKGMDTGLTIYEFCKEALQRVFGKSWIKKLADLKE